MIKLDYKCFRILKMKEKKQITIDEIKEFLKNKNILPKTEYYQEKFIECNLKDLDKNLLPWGRPFTINIF